MADGQVRGGGTGLLLGPRAGVAVHMEGVPVFCIVSVVSLLQGWERQAAASVSQEGQDVETEVLGASTSHRSRHLA